MTAIAGHANSAPDVDQRTEQRRKHRFIVIRDEQIVRGRNGGVQCLLLPEGEAKRSLNRRPAESWPIAAFSLASSHVSRTEASLSAKPSFSRLATSASFSARSSIRNCGALSASTSKRIWIALRFIPDRQTQMAELLSGGMDFLMHVPKDQADQVKAVPNLQVVSGETMRIVFLQMNAQESSAFPMLKNLKVRQALNHAIDREAMVKNLVGEGSRVINTICFPSQFGCTDEGAPRYPYDPQKAKQMLAEAGYPNGFDLPLYAYRERHQTEAMIGYLQAVGVKGNLNFLQYAAMRDQVRANKAGLVHQTWGSFSVNDVSAATPVYFGFVDDDIARDPEIRDLLAKGDNSVDPGVRKEAYKKALALIAERAYTIPLYSLPVYYAATTDLVFKAYPDEMPRFWEMTWK